MIIIIWFVLKGRGQHLPENNDDDIKSIPLVAEITKLPPNPHRRHLDKHFHSKKREDNVITDLLISTWRWKLDQTGIYRHGRPLGESWNLSLVNSHPTNTDLKRPAFVIIALRFVILARFVETECDAVDENHDHTYPLEPRG